jgi:N-acetyl-beta-hexosaminidase
VEDQIIHSMETESNTLTSFQKAQLMAEAVLQDILAARQKLAKEMKDNGMTPDKWVIVDNLKSYDGQEDFNYHCWPELNIRFERANNKEEI